MGDGLRKSVKFRPNSALAIAIEDLVRKWTGSGMKFV
jgi:hypothetical protein